MAFLTTYLLLGTQFGIELVKAKGVSWYRIQEVFRFQGFRMYGSFITATASAVPGTWAYLLVRAPFPHGS